jgi:hypothetical protein
MRSIIVEENDLYKDWGLDDNWKIPTVNKETIITIGQIIIDSLEIIDGFPKKKFGIFYIYERGVF